MSLKRIFVEKIREFDIESDKLRQDIIEFLHIKNVGNVRIFNCYDIEDIGEFIYEKALHTIFSEPQTDCIFEEQLPPTTGWIFATSYLKGQYDQRADSCVQCIQVLDPTTKVQIRVAKVYAIEGNLTEKEKDQIKKHLINPIEKEEISLAKPKTLDLTYSKPKRIKRLSGFKMYNEYQLAQFKIEEGLAMSLEDLKYFQDYFKSKDRDPSFTELKVVDTYWSDHCRHTTFMTELNQMTLENTTSNKPIKDALDMYEQMREDVYRGKIKKAKTLMDLATIGTKFLKKQGYVTGLVESEEINACTIEETIEVSGRKEDYLILFKNETHNHPTEIEPYGGAATCLGGAIRDPLSGRAYVYQAMRVTGASDPNEPIEETLPGKLPQRKITQTAALGYSGYGNQIGLATGEVKEYYHPGYKAKRLEVGAVVGAVKKENVRREEPVEGDVILLIGGATGRDGCGGATGSSKEHTEDSLASCGSEVQKGNPVEERKLQRLFRNPEFSKLIKRCNDFGAGGVCVAIGEIAKGLVIDLDAVPVKYKGLDGTELAISESQERMAIAIDKKDEAKVAELCKAENLEAVKVAVVTKEEKLIMKWQGEEIVHIDREFLDSAGVTQKRKVYIEAPKLQSQEEAFDREKGLALLEDLNIGLQKGLGMIFDGSVGSGSVLMPYGGKNQLTKEMGMVAKIPVLEGETDASTYMTHGFDPYLLEQSPFHGGLYAVVESISKLVALGADYTKTYLSFQEYFERLGDDPSKWGKPTAALLGALKAQKELCIAAIGGKDSMSGTFEALHVPPTLISFACNVGNSKNCVSGSFKKSGNTLVYLNIPIDGQDLPDFEIMKKAYKDVYQLIKQGLVYSAYSIGKGGLFIALAQMSIGNSIGAVAQSDDAKVTKACYGNLILEVDEEVANKIPHYFEVIGYTQADQNLIINGISFSLNEIITALKKPLEDVFASKGKDIKDAPDCIVDLPKKVYSAQQKVAIPKVVIPVFPGTNCEYDTRRAFEKAGANVEEVLLINKNKEGILESLKRFEKAIKSAQIIAFPGGFSAGDEPDGSGKFISAFMRSDSLKEALHRHLYSQDGLVIGICNGFQVLVKLGLLPYGEVRQMTHLDPTLTYNTIGKHISLLAKTKITSVQSPWLQKVKVGEVYEMPFSHGEGRFVAPTQLLEELRLNGQIFSQYVDETGVPVGRGDVNINGSMYNIEGIVSRDGRILGKMGHSERVGMDIHKNIPGLKDQKLFESGVAYYK